MNEENKSSNAMPIYRPEFNLEKRRINDFLTKYESNEVNDKYHGSLKYMVQMQNVANREAKLISISLEDLESFFGEKNNSKNPEQSKRDLNLLNLIKRNTKRYIALFSEEIDKVMPKENKVLDPNEFLEDKQEIIEQQRLANFNNLNADERNQGKIEGEMYPPELRRKYELVFEYGNNYLKQMQPLRELKASQIGSLIIVKGIVTKCTDVKPFLRVASYICEVCGNETYYTNYGRIFTPLSECVSAKCKTNKIKGELVLINRTSKFIPFQEIVIQEMNNEVPTGRVPTTMKVYCFGESTTRKCNAGDLISVTGVYLAKQPEDARLRGRLIQDTYIEAFNIKREKQSYNEMKISDRLLNEINNLSKKNKEKSSSYSQFYEKIARSLAPEIYGMDEIKKALLLLLVGGVDKNRRDGMKIRGAINILLMGDPGIAKSQLLKYISHISPRGVYTTGKGSSGVGLTAAVLRDPVTNDLVLEGGALVLADMGICCIDEFDKMSDYDRANIHEVMEQQTVSIAKAGITTRLNARTSILAAANPLYGRYNLHKTPHENINLPAALLSRFDLIFLLLDEADTERDLNLAKHITYVHQHLKPMPNLKKKGKSKGEDEDKLFSENDIKCIIAYAKKYFPVIPEELHNFIVQKYVEKRKEEKEKEKERDKEGYQYITPRNLLAIIRLSQALAKVKMSDQVTQEDITEALRLVDVSQSSINTKNNPDLAVLKAAEGYRKTDIKSLIFNVITDLCKKNDNKTAKISEILKETKKKKYGEDDVMNTIDEYVKLSIFYLNENKTEVTLL